MKYRWWLCSIARAHGPEDVVARDVVLQSHWKVLLSCLGELPVTAWMFGFLDPCVLTHMRDPGQATGQ